MTSNSMKTNASEKTSPGQSSLALDESLEVYNEKELRYLDKYLPSVRNAFDVKITIFYFTKNSNCLGR